jgi:hypothetical protein
MNSSAERSLGTADAHLLYDPVGVVAMSYGFYAGYVAISNSMASVNSGDASKEGFISSLKIIGDTFEKSKVAEHFKKFRRDLRQSRRH